MWGLYGGIMKSDDWFTDEKMDRHYFAILQGLVVTVPEHKMTNPKGRTKRPHRKYVQFVVATDKHEYQRVRVYEYEKFYKIAMAVQKYDTLMLMGEYVEHDYEVKSGRNFGEVRTARDFRTTFIIPAFAVLDPEGYRQAFMRPTDEHFFDMEPEDQDEDYIETPDWSTIPKEFEYGYERAD